MLISFGVGTMFISDWLCSCPAFTNDVHFSWWRCDVYICVHVRYSQAMFIFVCIGTTSDDRETDGSSSTRSFAFTTWILFSWALLCCFLVTWTRRRRNYQSDNVYNTGAVDQPIRWNVWTRCSPIMQRIRSNVASLRLHCVYGTANRMTCLNVPPSLERRTVWLAAQNHVITVYFCSNLEKASTSITE